MVLKQAWKAFQPTSAGRGEKNFWFNKIFKKTKVLCKCYASAMQALCKCCASAMQVLCKHYAKRDVMLCKDMQILYNAKQRHARNKKIKGKIRMKQAWKTFSLQAWAKGYNASTMEVLCNCFASAIMQVLCKCFASAMQVLCKCCASALQVLFYPYAIAMQVLYKCHAILFQIRKSKKSHWQTTKSEL